MVVFTCLDRIVYMSVLRCSIKVTIGKTKNKYTVQGKVSSKVRDETNFSRFLIFKIEVINLQEKLISSLKLKSQYKEISLKSRCL